MKGLLQGLQIHGEPLGPSAVTRPRSRRRTTRLALFGAVVAIPLMAGWWYFGRTKSAAIQAPPAARSASSASIRVCSCPFSGRVYDSYVAPIETTPHVTGATGVLRGLYSYQSKEHLVIVSGIDYDALANYPKPTTTLSERSAKARELKDFLEFRRMLSAMLLATIFVSVFGAANSVSMSVRERTREVGILRSLGLRKAHIPGILLGESTLLAAVGGTVGVAVASVILASERTVGGMVPLVLSPTSAAVGMGIALAIGLLGALVPGLNASRVTIVDSLRMVD